MAQNATQLYKSEGRSLKYCSMYEQRARNNPITRKESQQYFLSIASDNEAEWNILLFEENPEALRMNTLFQGLVTALNKFREPVP